MASLFKPTVTETKPDGTKRRRTVRKWYAKYRDADGRIRKTPLATDKSVARSMLAEIVRKVERQKAGLESPFEGHLKRPLIEHLGDFVSFLRDKDNTEKYVKLTNNRIRAVLEACGFEKPGDILAERVQRYLADRRRGGLSIESSNHYLRRVKEFCRWMFVHQRIPINPVAPSPWPMQRRIDAMIDGCWSPMSCYG